MSEFKLHRLGMLLEPELGKVCEFEGASIRLLRVAQTGSALAR
jgi:hypothetical protein